MNKSQDVNDGFDASSCYDALLLVVRKMCHGYDNSTGVELLRMDKPEPDRTVYVLLVFDSIELSEKDEVFVSLINQVVASATDCYTIVVAYSNPRYFQHGEEQR